MRRSLSIFGLIFIALLFSGCSSQPYRFGDFAPVTELDDRQPIPVPEIYDYNVTNYILNVLVRRPILRDWSFTRVAPSQDVNALDDVPRSTWFTPRLGYNDLSPQDLLAGPTEIGPPQTPITVTEAKSGGSNPGFIIADARGQKYLIKFDPPEFPAIETTTALIVNRLFWGFGYNVPEDFLFFFKTEDLQVDPEGGLSRAEVDDVLSRVAAPVDGVYRSTASLWLDGYLGPFKEKGVRPDDPNDTIRHENRRALRAMRAFCAFVNQSGIRPDNTLDIYVGPSGEGYVRHYLIDFGEAFGGHGASHGRLWDGYEYWFSYHELFRNLTTFGLKIHPWENIEYTPWPSVGAFESKIYEPQLWRETYPYEPIRRSQPADDYWAAKIIAALTHEHIETLVSAANYPDSAAAEYMVETIMERRKKTIRYFFDQVSPIECVAFDAAIVYFKDVARYFLADAYSETRYEAHFFDANEREIAEPIYLQNVEESEFQIPLPSNIFDKANGYVRVDVTVWRDEQKAPTPAAFHFRQTSRAGARLVGVVH